MSVERSIVCDRCASTVAVGTSVALARVDAALLGAQRRCGQDLCARCATAGDNQNDADVEDRSAPSARDGYARALGEGLVELIVECAREAVDSRLDEHARQRSDPAAYGPGSTRPGLPRPDVEVSASLELRPHQVQALADLTRAFAVHDRAVVVLPCGAGKTIVAAAHAAASESATTLVLVPSLALLAQTLREWRRIPGWSFDALVVCSDPTTSAGAAELAEDGEDGEDGVAVSPLDLSLERVPVTTDPGEVERFLRRSRPGRARVVFATYHSAPVVAAGQARAQVSFDLAACDLTNPP